MPNQHGGWGWSILWRHSTLLGIMKRNPLDDHPVEVSKPLILDFYNNTQHFKINIYIIVLSLVLLTMSLCTYFTLFIAKKHVPVFVGYNAIPNIILLPLISSRLDDWLGRSFSEAVQFDSKFAKVTVTGHSGFSLLALKSKGHGAVYKSVTRRMIHLGWGHSLKVTMEKKNTSFDKGLLGTRGYMCSWLHRLIEAFFFLKPLATDL